MTYETFSDFLLLKLDNYYEIEYVDEHCMKNEDSCEYGLTCIELTTPINFTKNSSKEEVENYIYANPELCKIKSIYTEEDMHLWD